MKQSFRLGLVGMFSYGGAPVKRSSVIALCFLGCLIAGCARTQDSSTVAAASPGRASVTSDSVKDPNGNTAAVTAAIDKHLRANSGINMSVMDMTVSNVKVNGDQAQANAEFHLKQGGTSMFITYKLERHAGIGWSSAINPAAANSRILPWTKHTPGRDQILPRAKLPNQRLFKGSRSTGCTTSP